MTTRILRSIGINWNHYAEVELDDENHTAKFIKQWRLHKFDENQGAGKHPAVYADYDSFSGFDITKWMDDGKPGGTDGLTANYKRTPQIRVNGNIYDVIQGEENVREV